MTVRVKICGITRVDDAEDAIGVGVDIIGLNFYPPSPRALSLEHAQRIRVAIGTRCAVAGVFVNATRQYIEERRRALKLDFIQFHGDEDDAALRDWPVKIIRAQRLRSDAAPNEVVPHRSADYTLLDTFHPDLFGGAGAARQLYGFESIDLSRVIIAGGLTPENVAAAARLHPYAVDVASGVESSPGIKDAEKMRSFVTNAKSAG